MRRVARELVFKLVFEYTFYEASNEGTLDFMLHESDLDESDKKFIKDTYDGVMSKEEELKALISSCLNTYKIERLYRPDYVVLLLATYELKQGEVPAPVIINEAVTLSKKYGTEKSGKFVNGVLANILKTIEE